MPFAEQAARLAGIAGALLGWRSDEFWQATPRELAGVLRAFFGEDGMSEPAGSGDLARLKEMFPDG